MRWEEWKFSARRAAQDSFIRWTTVATVVLFVGVTAYALVSLLPTAWRTGIVTMHYNIYLGIDDVRPWPWIFALPGMALVLLSLDISMMFGLYLRDAVASRTILCVGFLSLVLWSVGMFFLLRVNL